NDLDENPLYKSERVNNYLGMPGVTGTAMLEGFAAHAAASGAEVRAGRVLSIMSMGTSFYLSVGSDVVDAGAVILAMGVSRGKKYPGEAEFLGRGVSYCATCDGMLYRGKKVAVIGLTPDAEEEAEFLRGLGCQVLFWDKPQAYEITGTGKVEALLVNEELHTVDGVFILRPTLEPTDLLPGLALDGSYVAVDRQMQTNLPGVFAAGDCTGPPLQISKAVGEGLIAGQQAAEYLKDK
ncbi:MAG: NAD(P)/FAD-dependent oxidoreductase, partial [Clostridiales bacterium]|nr:NAD(P)/FAD-dependent oxidoreductase [Clostridiales bacterium]